ncbi:hypothetical protein V6Z11_A06G217100 [Gossypium hirsutum]
MNKNFTPFSQETSDMYVFFYSSQGKDLKSEWKAILQSFMKPSKHNQRFPSLKSPPTICLIKHTNKLSIPVAETSTISLTQINCSFTESTSFPYNLLTIPTSNLKNSLYLSMTVACKCLIGFD